MLSLFSFSCVLCDSTITGSEEKISLCPACQNDLPWMQLACDRCGVSLNVGFSDDKNVDVRALNVCGACQTNPPSMDYTLSALHYQSPVDYLVTELKFKKKLTIAAILSALLYRRIRGYYQHTAPHLLPDLIIPVPLHKSRLIKRGFNQAVEIAKPIAKQLSIPVAKNIITRVKNTIPQSDLSAVQRNKNIRNSFCLKDIEKLAGVSHVVIVDDVVTTGATCNELAGLLKKVGIKTVEVWAVARA